MSTVRALSLCAALLSFVACSGETPTDDSSTKKSSSSFYWGGLSSSNSSSSQSNLVLKETRLFLGGPESSFEYAWDLDRLMDYSRKDTSLGGLDSLPAEADVILASGSLKVLSGSKWKFADVSSEISYETTIREINLRKILEPFRSKASGSLALNNVRNIAAFVGDTNAPLLLQVAFWDPTAEELAVRMKYVNRPATSDTLLP